MQHIMCMKLHTKSQPCYSDEVVWIVHYKKTRDVWKVLSQYHNQCQDAPAEIPEYMSYTTGTFSW